MDLREIDLNLLVVFNQLLLDRSVSTSAEKLGLTQPAVSNALKRLRAVLKDELFLRTSRGMEPTPYALHLAEPVIYALNALQTAFTTRNSFDPLASTRTFNLAMTDIGEMYFVPPLMNALSEAAPHVRISTVRPNAGNLKEDMESGTVDLALGLLPNLQTGFFQRRLFLHKYVCMFRKGHPLAKSPMTLKQFTELDHVGILAANTGHGEVDGLLDRAGIKRKMRLVVPHFIAVGHITSDYRSHRHFAGTVCRAMRSAIWSCYVPPSGPPARHSNQPLLACEVQPGSLQHVDSTARCQALRRQ
uniref:LysR-like regular protein n=1 Tax=Polaromonas naphthalenivorans (strain CJ2) TaxID=365044 RepID=Q3S4D5_POLNA|nr:LysR-like regular protein [Polaromonas naphthalenivorans CJ2]